MCKSSFSESLALEDHALCMYACMPAREDWAPMHCMRIWCLRHVRERHRLLLPAAQLQKDARSQGDTQAGDASCICCSLQSHRGKGTLHRHRQLLCMMQGVGVGQEEAHHGRCWC
jgi:hypothetical protein